jgi:hypothetical protein
MHTGGNSFVTVAVGDHLAGVLELRSSHRPEAETIVEGLRAHGVKHLATISGGRRRFTGDLAGIFCRMSRRCGFLHFSDAPFNNFDKYTSTFH